MLIVALAFAKITNFVLDGLQLVPICCMQSESAALGDLSALLKVIAVVDFEYLQTSNMNSLALSDLCSRLGVRYKAFLEVRKLRRQLSRICMSASFKCFFSYSI